MSPKYKVETGIELTGIVYVEAANESDARRQARKTARENAGKLTLNRSFTNNVTLRDNDG